MSMELLSFPLVIIRLYIKVFIGLRIFFFKLRDRRGQQDVFPVINIMLKATIQLRLLTLTLLPSSPSAPPPFPSPLSPLPPPFFVYASHLQGESTRCVPTLPKLVLVVESKE